MKSILLSCILILSTLSFAQQASDYFPQQTGYHWNYKAIPLDENNNEIDSLTFFRADSFAAEINFMGSDADLVLSKSGPQEVINFLPYTDSSYFSFESSNAHQYFRISNLGNLLAVLDSIGLDPGSIAIIMSFEDWYSVFRFAQPVGNEYTIFSKDTTLSINGTDIPLRFQYLAKRLADETIQTEAGSFLCKKFLLSTVVSYILFPPIVIELMRFETTKWFSENVWLVQELTPSQTIDLTYLGYGTFTLPGLKTELINTATGVKSIDRSPSDFNLSQNYPNPFNPATRITFSVPEPGNVSLKIYNILGKEVSVLLDEQKNAGSYAVTFDPGTYNLSSGVYFYVLNYNGMQLSRKMIYLK
jgi:hypothetical protein